MKQKKIPLRSCVITKEKLPKQELVRVVKNKEGDVFVDITSKANGRGVYLKKDKEVFEKAQKNNVLCRHLKVDIDEKIYNDLKELLK